MTSYHYPSDDSAANYADHYNAAPRGTRVETYRPRRFSIVSAAYSGGMNVDHSADTLTELIDVVANSQSWGGYAADAILYDGELVRTCGSSCLRQELGNLSSADRFSILRGLTDRTGSSRGEYPALIHDNADGENVSCDICYEQIGTWYATDVVTGQELTREPGDDDDDVGVVQWWTDNGGYGIGVSTDTLTDPELVNPELATLIVLMNLAGIDVGTTLCLIDDADAAALVLALVEIRRRRASGQTELIDVERYLVVPSNIDASLAIILGVWSRYDVAATRIASGVKHAARNANDASRRAHAAASAVGGAAAASWGGNATRSATYADANYRRSVEHLARMTDDAAAAAARNAAALDADSYAAAIGAPTRDGSYPMALARCAT